MHRIHICRVGIRPAQINFRLAQRLRHVLLDSLDEFLPLLNASHRPWPRAHQRLVEEIFFIRLGRHASVFQRPLMARVQPHPAPHVRGPHIRHFRKHIQPVAHILAALGIVRRSRQHGVGRRSQPLAVRLMKVVGRDSEGIHRAADVIRRNEAVVDVEGGVLHALGHDRAGQLLEFQREVQLALIDLRTTFAVQQQRALQKIEDGAVHLAIALLGPRDGLRDERAVPLRVLRPRSSM